MNKDPFKEYIKESEPDKRDKGYHQSQPNALFDILNDIYIDCVLEPGRKFHERAAFNVMVDLYKPDIPAIIMADRGYEG